MNTTNASSDNIFETSRYSEAHNLNNSLRWESTPILNRGEGTNPFITPNYEDFMMRGPRQFEINSRGPRTPVWKWKIQKFDGHDGNLARFLTLVRHYAVAEGATDDDLFRNRIHLFTGDAADFVATHAEIRNWPQLVDELCQYVLGSNSDYDRLRSLERKKQGAETCAVFITRMDMLFRNMRQPPEEQQKVHIIMRGLKAHIRQALAGNTAILTLSNLRAAAQQVENIYSGSREIHAMDQENNNSRSRETRTPRDNSKQNSRDAGSRKPVICYRCAQTGHYKNECRNPPKLICFGCGKEGVIKSECPECQGNK